MLFKNTSTSTVRIAIGRGLVVEPSGTIDIDERIAAPRRADNGSRRPPIIQQLAPQLVPADEAERARWMLPPEHESAPRRAPTLVTVDDLVASGVARGKAVEMVKQIHRAALEGLERDERAAAPAAKARAPGAAGETK